MVKFILGFHCHQPVGNFDFVFKKVHEKSYSPLIRTLTARNVKFCLHVSGILLEWWEENDPELIKIIAKSVENEEIEIIGGGYYEPILAAIPKKDRLKQLDMLGRALKRLFGKYPEGIWIAERIWQPDIIKDLREAGLNYAFLDDFQFFQAGIPQDDIDSIFRTEYDGEYLDIFPIHERLRYKIPFAQPDESLNEIKYLNDRISKLSVMFDDAEKMGGWPDTFEWVYGKDGNKGWLENFIDSANSNDGNSGIRFELPSHILDNNTARVPVYLPISSYREMGEWTLPAEKRQSYEEIRLQNPSAPLGGGIWHNFLTRYPEANLHHKRMLNLSYKINYTVKTDHKYLEEALSELFKSQANDAYWHGVFGGIYLPHLRRAIRKALILSYKLYKGDIKEVLEKEYYDFDTDGEKEILFSNDDWLIIYKRSAGSFLALDYTGKDLLHSLGDVFCLHNEYDILRLKESSFKKGGDNENSKDINGDKKGGGEPPQTIHKGVKYPSDLSERDLITYAGLLPAFEIVFNGRQIYFKDEFIEEDRDKNFIKVKTAGFLKGSPESGVGDGGGYNIGNKINGSDGEVFASMEIKIGESLEFFINSKPKETGRLDIIFRFAFPGGDGPAVNVKMGEEIKGLNNYITKEFAINSDNFIYFSDSFWGGKINLKERTASKYLKKYHAILSPITTVSLSENGYERIFQGIELKYSFNLVAEEVFSSIIILDIENIKKDI
ncbi:MAG: alpha-amylase/4-alpha-glucanotransferase domain-containing protein [bacterium]